MPMKRPSLRWSGCALKSTWGIWRGKVRCIMCEIKKHFTQTHVLYYLQRGWYFVLETKHLSIFFIVRCFSCLIVYICPGGIDILWQVYYGVGKAECRRFCQGRRGQLTTGSRISKPENQSSRPLSAAWGLLEKKKRNWNRFVFAKVSLVLRYPFSSHKYSGLYFRRLLLQLPTPKGENKLLIKSTKTKLIISTGDTSDIDGFLALAEYLKVCYSHSIVQKIHFNRYRSISVEIMAEQSRWDHNIFPITIYFF